MRPFYSKDGRLIVPMEHIAKFNGKRNASKGRTLIFLSYNKGKYFTALELHQQTGVSFAYLNSRLSFWFNIRYVNRKPSSPAKGRPVWKYCIAERGENFVVYRIPPDSHDRYVAALNGWRRGDAVVSTVP